MDLARYVVVEPARHGVVELARCVVVELARCVVVEPVETTKELKPFSGGNGRCPDTVLPAQPPLKLNLINKFFIRRYKYDTK